MAKLSKVYDDVLLEHIRNARNFHVIDQATHRSEGINPLCGDSFTVYLVLDGERVVAASFQCECCGISMASASIMTELVRGKSRAQVAALREEFFRRLAAAEISGADGDSGAVVAAVIAAPSRHNCAKLAWQTMQAALDGQPRAVLTPA